MSANIYAYCAQCGFGIEINRIEGGKIHTEFIYSKGAKSWCYWCYESRKPRTTAELKRLLAESDVLLASAKRIGDAAATIFYQNQVNRSRAALGLDQAETAPQGNLF